MTDWRSRRVVVAGAGASGEAAARALLALGAHVTVVDARESVRTAALTAAGAALALGASEPPAGTSLIVASPGWRPDSPLFGTGVPVIGEVELAWQLRGPAPWLALTGTNGKTTTVRMLESMLRAAGERTVATGNVGLPVVDAVLAQPPYDVLAVELSSFQLHSAPSVRPAASAILNLAPDHLDWHGGFEAYAAAKEAIWRSPIAIGNADDEEVATRLRNAPGHRVAFTLGAPGADQLGVVDGMLVDRAFEGGTLAAVGDVRPAGPHNVANALAAAALARAHEVGPDAISRGLRAFVPDPHRNEHVAVIDGVAYVDDSKATNPHAAAASLTSYEPVVWIAGGLLKGAPVDELVAQVAPRLAGAVLLGADREVIAAAIARHAPSLPVVTVSRTDDGAMSEVVGAAEGLARAGDTVLLAPAAASMDMFGDYKARGDAFAAAVRALTRP